jgi:hypothetical protein
MKFAAVLIAAVALCVRAELPLEEGSEVIILGEDNFEEAKAAHSAMLVEFYAPW